MKKKQLSALFIFFTLLAAIYLGDPVHSHANSDQPSAWAQDSVDQAIAMGLVPEPVQSGYTQPITREKFTSLIIRAIEKAANKSAQDVLAERGAVELTNPFEDTENPDILYAYHLGIINGKQEQIFEPHALLARKEAAVILTNAAKALGRYPYNQPVEFSDSADIDEWARKSVNYVAHRAIMNGVADGQFAPNQTFTTEQAIITVLKLYLDDGKLAVSPEEREKIRQDGQKKAESIYVTHWRDTLYPKQFLNSPPVLVGDPVGYALETDTAVYIDGKFVDSYTVGSLHVIDIEDLRPFGYVIHRDPEEKLITIERDLNHKGRRTYADRVSKEDALVGQTVYTLVASDYRVSTSDSRNYHLSLAPYAIPSFTTSTGKTLIPLEYLHIHSQEFKQQGNIAFIAHFPEKKEIHALTVSDQHAPFATSRYGNYWAAYHYPEFRESMKDSELLQKAISILDEVLKPGMSEFEKEKAIYDYMVTYGKYDYNAYYKHKGMPVSENLPPANPLAYTASGALLDGLAVCDGWADAYHLLFTMAELESELHTGYLNGEAHEWVSVKVDGEWYQVESTTKSSSPYYHKRFNFTYEDGMKYLGYKGGNSKAVSRTYDELNGMAKVRSRGQEGQISYLDALFD